MMYLSNHPPTSPPETSATVARKCGRHYRRHDGFLHHDGASSVYPDGVSRHAHSKREAEKLQGA